MKVKKTHPTLSKINNVNENNQRLYNRSICKQIQIATSIHATSYLDSGLLFFDSFDFQDITIRARKRRKSQEIAGNRRLAYCVVQWINVGGAEF